MTNKKLRFHYKSNEIASFNRVRFHKGGYQQGGLVKKYNWLIFQFKTLWMANQNNEPSRHIITMKIIRTVQTYSICDHLLQWWIFEQKKSPFTSGHSETQSIIMYLLGTFKSWEFMLHLELLPTISLSKKCCTYANLTVPCCSLRNI